MRGLHLHFVIAVILVLFLAHDPVQAQRGTGKMEGVARTQNVEEWLSGQAVVEEVKIEECKKTTGRYEIGVHLQVKTEDGKPLNLHLGPAEVLGGITEEIESDTNILFKAFRTTNLPKDFYILQVLEFNGKEYKLRNKSLRPRWAGSRAARR